MQPFESTVDPLEWDDGWLMRALTGGYYTTISLVWQMFLVLIAFIFLVLVCIMIVNRAGKMVQPMQETPFVDAREDVLRRK